MSGAEGSAVRGDDADRLPDVCVVTHPLAAAGENATRSLLDVLAGVTGVALITADLPADSSIRETREVIEVSRKGAGESVPVAAARFLLNQLRIVAALRRRDEDVVLFFGATAYLLPILAARLLGRTVLVQPRGDVPLTLRIEWERRMPDALARALAGLVRGLERAGFRLAHGVVTYTPAMAAELGLDPDAPRVHPTGARYVDTDRFAVETPLEERGSVVGYLGRLDEEKGVRELAAVVATLPPGIEFRFVGDGDLRGWLEAELAEEIETGRVTVTGWVDHDDVPAELNRLRLLVLPSRPTEGLPTTILEAMACGTPVLASPVSGVTDVVHDGETGFLLGSRDPEAVLADVEAILARDDLADVGRAGRALVEAEYDFDAACERYRGILLAVADERSGRR